MSADDAGEEDGMIVSGWSRWCEQDGSWSWAAVTVDCYDEAEERFEVRWVDSPQVKAKLVGRLNLLFEGEEPSLFFERCCNARKAQLEAECAVRHATRLADMSETDGQVRESSTHNGNTTITHHHHSPHITHTHHSLPFPPLPSPAA